MRFLRQIFCAKLAVAILLVGCATQLKASAAGPSESELIDGYRQAHNSRDLQAMLKLYCWDRVTPEIRKMSEAGAKAMFEEKIVSIEMTSEHPKGRINQYIRSGVTYGLNLTPVKELVVETRVSNSPPASSPASSYYPVGIKDGHYRIAVAAPVPNGAAPAPEFPAVATTTASGHAAGIRKGERVVVPAQTEITVRLKQVVGTKLLATGGAFSAVVSDPVQVSGVTVIPVGTMARGIVTKPGKYSPEMALTEITLDGRSHRVSTVTVSFNEQISFPAGSETSFHLLLPLKLEP